MLYMVNSREFGLHGRSPFTGTVSVLPHTSEAETFNLCCFQEALTAELGRSFKEGQAPRKEGPWTGGRDKTPVLRFDLLGVLGRRTIVLWRIHIHCMASEVSHRIWRRFARKLDMEEKVSVSREVLRGVFSGKGCTLFSNFTFIHYL